jgi:hypothetical protein
MPPEVGVLDTRDGTSEKARRQTEDPRPVLERPAQTAASELGGAPSSRDGFRGRQAKRRFPMKKGLAVGILVLIAAVAAFLFFRPVAVTVAAVTTRDIAPAIQGVGTVETKVVVSVSSK